jgi:hypothetical protein
LVDWIVVNTVISRGGAARWTSVEAVKIAQ